MSPIQGELTGEELSASFSLAAFLARETVMPVVFVSYSLWKGSLLNLLDGISIHMALEIHLFFLEKRNHIILDLISEINL
jgi:hypothetical protein